MAFWNKNPNETAFTGGRKHWTDVIKNSGRANLLLWKQPEEDFNTNSTLIVMPGETAMFVHGGNIERIFDAGTYKLTTENYPFISRLRNQFSGGISTFNCVVYFVREAHSREINWGITPAIQVRDPVHGIMCKLRANGAYKIRIADPSKFLMYMLGSKKDSFAEEEMKEYFGNTMQMHIRTLITQFIKSSDAEVLGICEYQIELSILITPFLINVLDKYGISLEDFSIATLDIPDDDPNRITLETAFAQHAGMKVLGEDWARLKSAEILEKLAENPGAGGVASMGAGMGMGMAAAPIFSNLAQQMFGHAPAMAEKPSNSAPPPFGDVFGNGAGSQSQPAPASIPSFNPVTGQSAAFPPTSTPVQTPGGADDFEKSMQKLKYMKENGFISQEAYEAKINEILSGM